MRTVKRPSVPLISVRILEDGKEVFSLWGDDVDAVLSDAARFLYRRYLTPTYVSTGDRK